MTGFSTTRLAAEQVTPAHGPIFQALWGDERVAHTLGGPRDAAAVERSLAASVEDWNKHGFGRWLLRRGEVPVGTVKLAQTRVTGQLEVELGYALFPEYWGQGYATEAARGALSVADARGLETVIGFALTTNRASLGVMQRLGFLYEKTIELPAGAHAVWRLALNHAG